MRIYQLKRFHRFVIKNHISKKELLDTVFNAEQGLISADLGGGVIKQRILNKVEENPQVTAQSYIIAKAT